MRRNTDKNHAEIAAAFRGVGATVLDLSAVGGGCPDLAVGLAGVDQLVEVKNTAGRNRIDPTQVEFHGTWKGRPVAVARTVDDVVAIVAAMVTGGRYDGRRAA